MMFNLIKKIKNKKRLERQKQIYNNLVIDCYNKINNANGVNLPPVFALRQAKAEALRIMGGVK